MCHGLPARTLTHTRGLSRYDDFVVDGKKVGGDDKTKGGIRLGEEAAREQRQAQIRARLQAAAAGRAQPAPVKREAVSLKMEVKQTDAFMTAEEADAAFRKPKGVKKLRRKRKERFELQPEDGGEGGEGGGDLGTRESRGKTRRELEQVELLLLLFLLHLSLSLSVS